MKLGLLFIALMLLSSCAMSGYVPRRELMADFSERDGAISALQQRVQVLEFRSSILEGRLDACGCKAGNFRAAP